MSDDYGKNVSALILSVVVSCKMLLVTHKYWDASVHLQHLTALHEGWSPLPMHFRELSNAQIGSVATAAGIGGGAFFVPLFNILLNFSRLLTSTRVIPFLCCSSVDSQMLCQYRLLFPGIIFGTSWDAERKKRAVLPGLKGAIALSQAVIAGGAVAGVAVTLYKKHPHDPSKPLMDFDIALMLLPSQLLGLAIG